MSVRIVATYFIETPIGVAKAAELLASEQSIGSFTRVVGETDVVVERFGAKVESLEPLDAGDRPSLPTALPVSAQKMTVAKALATISFPAENFAPNVPSLFAILAGNLFELQELTGVRLLDFDLPSEFANQFPGPAFGIAGTRKKAGVPSGPIIGTIVKPKLGLSAAEIGGLTHSLAMAGIDFIKDDECMTSPLSAPFNERVDAVSAALDIVFDRIGRRPMYAFNISDDGDRMRENHDAVWSAGGTCVMVSVNACGFSSVAALRRHSELPIHAHRAGWGMLTRHPLLGMSFTAYQKLWRLAGIDQIHIGGLQSKFFEDDASVISSALDCMATFPGHEPIMPVISSGQWGGQAAATFEGIGSDDVIYLAGGGILGHPMGPPAGIQAIRQAWEAARAGVDLAEHARACPELQASIEKFSTMREERANANH
jgi:ribulose-bisphosphate carboxylase large chain